MGILGWNSGKEGLEFRKRSPGLRFRGLAQGAMLDRRKDQDYVA